MPDIKDKISVFTVVGAILLLTGIPLILVFELSATHYQRIEENNRSAAEAIRDAKGVLSAVRFAVARLAIASDGVSLQRIEDGFLDWGNKFGDNSARLKQAGISPAPIKKFTASGKIYYEDTLKLIGIARRNLDLEAECFKNYSGLRASSNALQKLLRDNGLYAVAVDVAGLSASEKSLVVKEKNISPETAGGRVNQWFTKVRVGLISAPAATRDKRLVQQMAAYLSRHREKWLEVSGAIDRLGQGRKELILGLQNNDSVAQGLNEDLVYLEKALSDSIENEDSRLAGRRKRAMLLAVAAAIFLGGVAAMVLRKVNKSGLVVQTPVAAVSPDSPNPERLPKGLQGEDIRGIIKIIENLFNAMQKDSNGLLGLARGAYAGDYLCGHSVNAAILAMGLGMVLGMNKDNLVKLGTSAVLHDIGMVKIPKEILKKKESLTPEELQQIRRHPRLGEEILEGIGRIDEEIKSAVAEHHERYAGQGYPRGIADDEIHRFACIVGLVDIYEALTHSRVYRHKCLSHEEAISEISGLDKQDCFDKKILAAFLKMSERFGKV